MDFLYARNLPDEKLKIVKLVDDKFVTQIQDAGVNPDDLETATFGQVIPIRKIVVFINPASGSGRAARDWEKTIRPFLIDSGKFEILIELVTERAGQAEECSTGRPAETEAVLTVGGDGMLSEVVNGLWRVGKFHAGAKPLPIYPLPCGSGNGLATSLFAAANKSLTLRAALRAVLAGKTQPVDLFKVTCPEKTRIAFLSVTFGLLADTDIDSERLRCFGSARFPVCGLWNIFRNRAYPVRVTFSRDGESTEKLSGDFTSITVFNVSHANHEFVAAAERAAADGFLSLVCVGKPGRVALFRGMLAAETGSQAIKFEWWKPLSVKAFSLDVGEKGSYGAGLVVDGERWLESTISGNILTEQLTTFLP